MVICVNPDHESCSLVISTYTIFQSLRLLKTFTILQKNLQLLYDSFRTAFTIKIEDDYSCNYKDVFSFKSY